MRNSLVLLVQKRISTNILIAIFVTVGILVSIEAEQRYFDFRRLHASMLTQLQLSLAYPLWTMDETTIHSILSAAQKEGNIGAILLYNENGKIIHESYIGGLKVPEFRGKWNIVRTSKEIYRDADLIGRIEILVDYSPVVQFILLELAIVFTMALVVMYYVRRNTVRFLTKNLTIPLKQLTQRAQNIRAGNYQTGFSSIGEDNEFEELNLTFKEMAEAIQDRDAALTGHNDNLEKLVGERTQQLEAMRANSLHASRLASLGEMSAGIAHEINNPLAVILGQIELI